MPNPGVLYLMGSAWPGDHWSIICYDRVTPHDGNTCSFSKEQMKGSTSVQRGSAQNRPIIKQALDKRQNGLLPRQWNNKSSNQEQTPREREIRRLREGGVWSQNHWTPMTADQRLTAETRTQTTMARLKAVESQPQGTTTQPTGGQSHPQYTMMWLTQWKSCPW
jgi:hypothetical protein